MTPEERAKHLLPIISAFAEGKIIQVKNGNSWEDKKDLSFGLDSIMNHIKPEKQKMWLNVFDGVCQMGFSTKAKADEHAKQIEQSGYTTVRKACIEIEFEPGEGL